MAEPTEREQSAAQRAVLASDTEDQAAAVDSEQRDARNARNAQERSDVQADTERRDARDVLELAEVKADTERREDRDVLELAEVTADTERRDARDVLEVAELKADTERREQLQALRDRSQAQLQQAQRLENLGQLAGGIAHTTSTTCSR